MPWNVMGFVFVAVWGTILTLTAGSLIVLAMVETVGRGNVGCWLLALRYRRSVVKALELECWEAS